VKALKGVDEHHQVHGLTLAGAMAGLRGLVVEFKAGREFEAEPKFNLKPFAPPLSDFTSASEQWPRDLSSGQPGP
ncbi:MAG: hypothetical protein RXO24_07790, partial [Acidilobus sp.]